MEGIRRTSTVRQLELLVEFVEGNRDLALGRLRSKEGRELSKRLWRECAAALNSEGPARNHKEWTKVWNDMKSRVRAKLIAINQSHQGTGGGPKLSVTLSALEDRVANMIGRDVGPLPNVAQDHFEATSEVSNNSMVVEEFVVQIENTQRHASESPSPSYSRWTQPQQTVSRQLASQLSTPPHVPRLAPPQPTESQQLSQSTPPRSAPPQSTESPLPSLAPTPRRGRGRRPRRARRSAPNSPRESRVQTQAQSSRIALDESRAMVMRIEELRAKTDEMRAQSALRQAEAAKAHAEAAKAQAEAAIIAANAEKLKAETMAAFYTTLSSLVPSITQFLRGSTDLAPTPRMLSEEYEEVQET